MSISKDFEELFALFTAHGVKALVVGGYAFAFHAKPRYTQDIDIWIEPTPENAERLLRALEGFGFGALDLTVEDFMESWQFVQLGYPPDRIDLLTSIPGVDFAEAWANRVEDLYGNQTVAYLGREELIRNKEVAGRPQDLADLAVLKRFGKGKS